ncbi:MAG TPA: hypothetical protein VKT31_03965 [Solirubrobacteraceae bacterium]|nr:hypothetical protein [Solirubrobacteraceae bacterium]
MVTVAASYLAGSILTLLMPTGLFIIIGLWHLGVAKRHARHAGEEPPTAAILPNESVGEPRARP